MAKVILKFDATVKKEIPLVKATLSIGRTPDNDVVIDNPAVSGHHARILVDGDHFQVEDMNSLNGTFVNSQRIRKSPLKDGDEILVGKHTLVFQGGGSLPQIPPAADGERTQPLKPLSEQTVVLDTKARREFLAKATSVATEGVSPSAQEKIGCLTVIAGKSPQPEYILTSKLSVIGKSEMASVKIKGWFAPKVAAVINRKPGGYSIAPSDKIGATKVNSQPLTASRELQEGDVIEVSRVKLQFYFRE